MKKILTAFSLTVLLASCQKEVSFETVTNPGGNANGDLLVKALQVSPATNDTNVITFKWDNNKRLLAYEARGKVQGSTTNISHQIQRASDGKVIDIFSKTFISTFAGNITDSSYYRYRYVPGSNKVACILATRYTSIGDIDDSTVLTYNAANQVVTLETFSDFLTGSWDPFSKQEVQYDAKGNPSKIINYQADLFGSTYRQASVGEFSYDGHKAAVDLGEECYAILGPQNIVKNNSIKTVSNAVASGTTYTTTYSQFKFNSFDRPTESFIAVTPQPPGYNQKVFYYYQ